VCACFGGRNEERRGEERGWTTCVVGKMRTDVFCVTVISEFVLMVNVVPH
jgi:hypothetical protein